MPNRLSVGGIVVVAALAFSACQAQTTGESQTGVSTSGARSDSNRDARGATMGSGSGSGANASNPAPAGPNEKETARGNTPPGVSRDGQGPAAGAIVDPAGVTKK
jgi:hypothetical protein